MTDDTAPVTVTIKGPGRYDQPWIVFRGDNDTCAATIREAFGIDDDGYTVWETVMKASSIAQAHGEVSAQLGGTPIGQGKPAGNEGDDKADPTNYLLKQIDEAKSKDELKDLYARNQELFKSEKVQNAARNKSQTLSN